MNQFPLDCFTTGAALAEGTADGAGVRLPLKVALTLAPGATEAPGAPGAPGATPAGGIGTGVPIPGGGGLTGAPGCAGAAAAGAPGAPGFAGAAAFGPAGAGALGGGGGGGAAGLFCANAHKAIKLRQRVSSVFISAAMIGLPAPLLGPIFIPDGFAMSPAKIFHCWLRCFTLAKLAYLIRIICARGM
jgi:hypothetical protein